MKKLKYIFIPLLLMCLTSCIYDYPIYIPAGTQLSLTFRLDTSVVDKYPQMNDLTKEEYDIRYVIKAYRMTNSGEYNTIPHIEYIYTKDDITSLDSTFLVELDEGQYTFYTIADYVPQYSTADYHYSTSSFSDLHLRCDEYHGNTDSKILYTGYHEINIKRFDGKETSCDTISLTPVMTKYQIIATDIQKFYKKMTTRSNDTPDFVGMHLENYKVKVRYDKESILYTHMDICNGSVPTKGEKGLSYDSRITKLNENEAMLCFDHIMIGPEQKIIKLRVSIYREDGSHVTTIPIEFDVTEGNSHCIYGEFLTYVGLEDPDDDGVILDTDFDGDIDIQI